jgi:hypothetical protein
MYAGFGKGGKMPKNKPGDIIIRNGKYICRIERFVGENTAVLQEMDYDKLGRLRSIGEEGRCSTTREAAESAPKFENTEQLGTGETVNNLLPMPPQSGPPLPKGFGVQWPWKK